MKAIRLRGLERSGHVFILYDVYTIRLANDIRDKMIEREKEGETK